MRAGSTSGARPRPISGASTTAPPSPSAGSGKWSGGASSRQSNRWSKGRRLPRAGSLESVLRLARGKELCMATPRSLVLVTCALVSAPAAAAAQQATPTAITQQASSAAAPQNLPVEVSPFVASGGDSTSVGVAVRWPFMSRLGLEFEAEYRHMPARPVLNSLENNGVNGNVNLVV